MKISVVVPVLNEEQSTRTLLDGLLSQTRPPDEILIVDGGSTDATPRIVEEYKAQTARVRLICEANAKDSSSKTRNLRASQQRMLVPGYLFAAISTQKHVLDCLSKKVCSYRRVLER